MTDEEIQKALSSFPEVWQRVGSEVGKLPEALVLMPGKGKKVPPCLR